MLVNNTIYSNVSDEDCVRVYKLDFEDESENHYDFSLRDDHKDKYRGEVFFNTVMSADLKWIAISGSKKTYFYENSDNEAALFQKTERCCEKGLLLSPDFKYGVKEIECNSESLIVL